MLNSFRKYIEENKLIKAGDRILLTVSGGIDSMVMADLFLHLGNEVGIAHCNFSLRAAESDKDEDLVRRFASKNNLPFHLKQFETKNFARKNRLSVQMAARELRYSWFEELRIENGYNSIAVAHNLNDNIETLLINLTRGTGIAGLIGMKPMTNNIIRPLLFATRKEITAYGEMQGIVFREDMSNADTKYIRNKIRHLVIPILKEINPSIEYTLDETAERFAGINDIVNDYIDVLRESMSEPEGDLIIFHISRLKKYISNKTIIFELFKPFGISNTQLHDLVKVTLGNTGGQIFTETHRIIKNRKELIVSKEIIENHTVYKINNIKDFKNVPGIISAALIKMNENYNIEDDPFTASIDSEKLSFPMLIRKWKPGDYFYPLGMKQKKKLSDYFIDRKYSRLEKEDRLILESGEKIVWIIGDRLDNRFRITKSTKKALIIKSTKKALVIKPVV